MFGLTVDATKLSGRFSCRPRVVDLPFLLLASTNTHYEGTQSSTGRAHHVGCIMSWTFMKFGQ